MTSCLAFPAARGRSFCVLCSLPRWLKHFPPQMNSLHHLSLHRPRHRRCFPPQLQPHLPASAPRCLPLPSPHCSLPFPSSDSETPHCWAWLERSMSRCQCSVSLAVAGTAMKATCARSAAVFAVVGQRLPCCRMLQAGRRVSRSVAAASAIVLLPLTWRRRCGLGRDHETRCSVGVTKTWLSVSDVSSERSLPRRRGE